MFANDRFETNHCFVGGLTGFISRGHAADRPAKVLGERENSEENGGKEKIAQKGISKKWQGHHETFRQPGRRFGVHILKYEDAKIRNDKK